MVTFVREMTNSIAILNRTAGSGRQPTINNEIRIIF